MHTLHKATDLFPIPLGSRFTEKSFRFCGVAYDNILAAGMKPFVELGFMPKHLAKKNARGMFFYKPNISPPKSYKQWREYIQSFILFLTDRYGKEEVETWFFEVWNEPDLRMPFFAGSKEDYFRLYAETARAIKEINKNIRVGGPSTSASKWIEEFREYCTERDVPLDFITTHQYAGDPLGGITGEKEKTNININIFAAMGKNAPSRDSILGLYRRLTVTENVYSAFISDGLIESSAAVRRQARSLPVYYTEWNLCASFSAPCNDTRMVAAYDVHSILGTGDTIDGSSIWCFTDLFEELHPFPEEFHGGFGILTQSGIKKPLFHALRFLRDVGDTRIILPESDGKADLAAFRSEKGTQIIAALPVLSEERDKEDIAVNVESDTIPQRVTVRRIDENSGNPLKIWQEMGSPKVPNKNQLEAIKEKSAVCEEDMPFEYSEGKIKLSFTLHENDVCLIELHT